MEIAQLASSDNQGEKILGIDYREIVEWETMVDDGKGYVKHFCNLRQYHDCIRVHESRELGVECILPIQYM
jgi:hypothetical protein